MAAKTAVSNGDYFLSDAALEVINSLANGRDEPTTCAEEAAQFNECPAVCRLFAGEVRALGFDAVADKPNHANITGLPDVPPADIATPEGRQARADAEFIGGELAKRAVVVWQGA